jgi:lipopolysaccharide export system protein LptA
MRKIKTLIVPACLFAAFSISLFICCPLSCAAEKAEKAEKKAPMDVNDHLAQSDAPIHITADRMESNQSDKEQKTITFDGHVFVQQEDMNITSNHLKVFLLPGEKVEKAPDAAEPTASQKIDYIVFEGDVKVTSKDRLATADKAIFYQKEQKVTLHGRPVVTQGQDRVEGNLITIYLQQSLSIVEGGSGAPVQAVLYPEKKE